MTIKAINRKEVDITITHIPTGMRLLKQAGFGDPNALCLTEFVWRFRFYRVRFRDKQARSQR